MKKIIPNSANLIPEEAKKVFEGKIYSVYQWPQKMFDGSFDTFEMLKRPDTVIVIAVKGDKLVVLKQRQPNLKMEFLDFPGGRADSDESPLKSAKRELLEETGMTFKNWRLIDVKQASWKIEQFLYTYLATDFVDQAGTKHDNGEKIEQELMSFDQVLAASEGQARLKTDLLKRYGSIETLIKAPEFEGAEIETT